MLYPESPVITAPKLAEMLASDPIAAGQVKEHIKPERLLELLNLSVGDFAHRDWSIGKVLNGAGIDCEDVLDYVVSKFSKGEIMRMLDEY